MRLLRKLTNKEWKEIGRKYKDGGVHMYKGKKTLFYNGEILCEHGQYLVFDREERKSWEVIIVLPGVKVIPWSTFLNCENVKEIIMADAVERIGEGAFEGCKSLVFVRLSRNLEYIGHGAFAKCDSLTSIFIPPSCKEIGNYAFYGCKKLILFHVPQYTKLSDHVIAGTALIKSCALVSHPNGNYNNHNKVNKWIKNRQTKASFLHHQCFVEKPLQHRIAIARCKEECYSKDDYGLTPLIYLMYICADYNAIEYMVQIGGRKLLFIKDKNGWNALHHACNLGDEAIIEFLQEEVEGN